MAIVSVHLADVGIPTSLRLLRRPRPASIDGLLHADTGIAATFGKFPARPSPRRIGLICSWSDHDALDRFEAEHPLAQRLADGLTVHARPLRIHGGWPGIDEDVPKRRDVAHDGPVMVVTLARTKATKAVPFGRASTPAERAVTTAPGNLFTSAVIRYPFMSTVSLWESTEAVQDYAYSGKQTGHPEAIAAGRAKSFHHQQAFVRLAIDSVTGSLGGSNPLTADTVRLAGGS